MGSLLGAWRARSLFAAPTWTRRQTPRWAWWPFAAVAVALAVLVSIRALGIDEPGLFHWLTDQRQPLVPAVFLGSILVATWLYGRARGLVGRVVGVLTVSAFAAGALVLGFVSYVHCTPTEPPFFGPLILVLSGNGAEPWGVGGGCPAEPPLAHHLARLCAVWGALGGVLGVVVTVLRRQIDRWQAGLSGRAVLVLGEADEKGKIVGVLDQSRSRGTDLIVVDPGKDDGLVSTIRLLGGRVITAESVDDELLTQVLTRRGRVAVDSVYIIERRVPEALSLFARVARILDEARPDDAVVPRVLVRLDDPWAAENWRRSNVVGERLWLADALSATEQTAQALVERMAPAPTSRLVLAGHGELADAVLAEVAQTERERRVLNPEAATNLEVVLVDPAAADLATRHAAAEAAFGNDSGVSEVRVVAQEATDAVLTSTLGDDDGSFVLLTESDPEVNRPTRLAGRLPETTIWAVDPSSTELPEWPLLGRLTSFGVGIIPRRHQPEDHWTRLARLLHNAYLSKLGEQTDPRPSARPWSDLPTFYRTSNLRQVQRLLAGVTLLGRTWTGALEDPLSEDELVFLGRNEHESWRRFYEANGWTYAAQRDDTRLQHNWLVDWSALPDEARARTSAGLKDALALLATAGYRSQRVTESASYRRTGEIVAEKLVGAWTWQTESGATMTAAEGDFRVLDPVTGRRWSVDSTAFAATHEALGNGRFRRVGAVQARPAHLAEEVHTLEGDAVARPGDWVVTGALGEQWLVPGERFREAYEPL